MAVAKLEVNLAGFIILSTFFYKKDEKNKKS